MYEVRNFMSIRAMSIEDSINSSLSFEHDAEVVLVGTFRFESLFTANANSVVVQQLYRLDVFPSVDLYK